MPWFARRLEPLKVVSLNRLDCYVENRDLFARLEGFHVAVDSFGAVFGGDYNCVFFAEFLDFGRAAVVAVVVGYEYYVGFLGGLDDFSVLLQVNVDDFVGDSDLKTGMPQPLK